MGYSLFVQRNQIMINTELYNMITKHGDDKGGYKS